MSTRPIQAVMITMKGREETTKATAAQFKKIGLPPKIFTQPANKPVGAVSNRWNGSRAIKYALEQEADCLIEGLFCRHRRAGELHATAPVALKVDVGIRPRAAAPAGYANRAVVGLRRIHSDDYRGIFFLLPGGKFDRHLVCS